MYIYKFDKALDLARNNPGVAYPSSGGAVLFTSSCITDPAVWPYPDRSRSEERDQRYRDIMESYRPKLNAWLNGNSSCRYRYQINAMVADEIGVHPRTVERAVKASATPRSS